MDGNAEALHTANRGDTMLKINRQLFTQIKDLSIRSCFGEQTGLNADHVTRAARFFRAKASRLECTCILGQPFPRHCKAFQVLQEVLRKAVVPPLTYLGPIGRWLIRSSVAHAAEKYKVASASTSHEQARLCAPS